MQHTTRNKFLVAVAAGVITCGGALATATASNADPGASAGASGSATSATGAPTTTTTTAPSGDPTSAPTGPSSTVTSTAPSGEPTVPANPKVDVTPTLTTTDNGIFHVAGFRVDGEIFANPTGRAIDYTANEIYVDGEIVTHHDGDRFGAYTGAAPRALHATYTGYFSLDLSPGKHTVTVEFYYPDGFQQTAHLTATKTFTVGSATSPTTAPTQPSNTTAPGGSGEPPTPSPKTTRLGVTG